jgi:hypothetical protein
VSFQHATNYEKAVREFELYTGAVLRSRGAGGLSPHARAAESRAAGSGGDGAAPRYATFVALPGDVRCQDDEDDDGESTADTIPGHAAEEQRTILGVLAASGVPTGVILTGTPFTAAAVSRTAAGTDCCKHSRERGECLLGRGGRSTGYGYRCRTRLQRRTRRRGARDKQSGAPGRVVPVRGLRGTR